MFYSRVYAHMGAWCPHRPDEGVTFSGTGVTDDGELLCRHWEWNLGPQKCTQCSSSLSHPASSSFAFFKMSTSPCENKPELVS